MAKRIADLIVEVIANAGVERVYSLSGDSLNGITDAIRKNEQVQWIHIRHEESAAFAAGAEAHLTEKLAVCAGGPFRIESGSKWSRERNRRPREGQPVPVSHLQVNEHLHLPVGSKGL